MRSDEFIRSSNLFSRLDACKRCAAELEIYAAWALADIDHNRRAAELCAALSKLTGCAAKDLGKCASAAQQVKISLANLDELALAVNQVTEDLGKHSHQLELLRDITPELTHAGGLNHTIEQILDQASVEFPRLAAVLWRTTTLIYDSTKNFRAEGQRRLADVATAKPRSFDDPTSTQWPE